MKVSEIVYALEQWADPSLQESYDNSGLLTGSPDAECGAALVTLDATEEVIDEAIEKQCKLVIAHHPVIFSGIKRLTANNHIERTVIKAVKNDIAIYSIHTNLDNIYSGVNSMIAAKLGLENCRILRPIKGNLVKLVTFVPSNYTDSVRLAICEAGAGHIGNYDLCTYNSVGFGTYRGNENSNAFKGEKGVMHREQETRMEVIFENHLKTAVLSALKSAHPYEEVAYDLYALENEHPLNGAGLTGELKENMTPAAWLRYLKKKMNIDVVRYTETYKEHIKTVAVCGGSGSFLLGDAIRKNADAFVTADFKYHDFFNAEGRLMICDVGHYESEIFTTELIRDKLLANFPTFAVQISGTSTNPVKYI